MLLKLIINFPAVHEKTHLEATNASIALWDFPISRQPASQGSSTCFHYYLSDIFFLEKQSKQLFLQVCPWFWVCLKRVYYLALCHIDNDKTFFCRDLSAERGFIRSLKDNFAPRICWCLYIFIVDSHKIVPCMPLLLNAKLGCVGAQNNAN